VGQGFELDSIAAVVMGGTSLSGGIGGLGGTVLGVLIISTINNLLNLLNVSGFYQHVVKGIVIIISITLYKGRS
jgi:ribose/xylose/arabinose/galactoside ABC-type transport system permease subunit